MTISDRKEREKEKRRNDIVDAAEALFFSKGYEAVTLDEIADKAELSKGTLYLYFKNKLDLYFFVAGRGLQIMIDMFQETLTGEKTGLQKVRAIGEAYHRFFTQHGHYFQTVNFWDSREIDSYLGIPGGETCHQLGNQALGMVARAVAEGVADGSIRPDIDPAKAAVVLWGQATGVFQLLQTKVEHFLQCHDDFPFASVEEIVAFFFDMIERSLLPGPGGKA
ncbi:MAG: TetR/AcrR family transcriptional regulator [Candidatus Aminicenantes bacterium]|nr:TetR/AcrR family transcriptional regulator [Candidatus Aminicenantes bacterium]